MRKGILLLSALIMVLAACRKDIEDVTVTGTDYEPPVVVVNGSVMGLVLGEDGEPIPSAMVRMGGELSITNEAGIYRFDNTSLNARGTYISVEKAGYFHGSKRFYPGNNTATSVNIQLLPLRSVGTVSGAAGGQVSFAGASLTLPAEGVVDAQNQIYTGNVQVAAHWLNPTADNLDAIMPGNLEGVDTEGRQVGMATFGMLAVELMSETGEALQVAPGRKATISVPVPAEIAGLAPAEIPLWHFDEALGIWVEEGKASLQNGNYVGEVSHFSFWNCDVPYDLIYITGRLMQVNGVPVGGKTISITAEGIGRTGYGVSADDGTFSGLVPADEVLTITVVGACQELSVTTVGPYTEDTDIGDILVADPNLVNISGTVTDCNGDGIAGASVRINGDLDYYVTATDEDGGFYYQAFVCEESEVTVQAFDAGADNQTDPVTQLVSSDTDFGDLQACDNPILEYIQHYNDGASSFFLDPQLSIMPDSIVNDTIGHFIYANLQGSETTPWESIQMMLPDLAVGSYTGTGVSYYYGTEGQGQTSSLECYEPCSDVTITITANEGVGGYLRGNFTGTVDGRSSQTQVFDVPISGEFSILIE